MYAYLFGSSLFLIPWLIFYFLRKDLRKEMVIVSVVIGTLGVIAEWLWYVRDWVRPVTITGTIVGIEDFILGFGAGGVSAVIYKEFFHKTMYRVVSLRMSHWILVLPVIAAFSIAHLLFAYFGWFSFWANLVGFGVGIIAMSLLRKDLEQEAIVGGLLLTILTLPLYWLTFFLFPTWRQEYWNYERVSGFLVLGIPYEDLVWWFFAGAFVAVLYDYWNLLRLRKV